MDENIALPAEFLERMGTMLGSTCAAFIESYGKERAQGLRINLLKASPEEAVPRLPFYLRKISWVDEGFYYGGEDRPGLHPFHEAGVYYIQEPSAMAVIALLNPLPGEFVLDLCAAPGGKTSHIASRMGNCGLLVSNEIHPARAKILSRNVERMGIRNAVVTNEASGRLAEYFPEFFDRIAVDAPCSGEGMFRKEEDARKEWSPDNVKACAARQKEILKNAYQMLKPQGRIVYSTCTFSPEENEQVVEWALSELPDCSLEEPLFFPGFSQGEPRFSLHGTAEMKKTIRIWPHRTEGEGHFIAILKKGGEERRIKRKYPHYPGEKRLFGDYEAFCKENLKKPEWWINQSQLLFFGEQLYLVPEGMLNFDKLKVLRPGLHLGTQKKGRFEPSHALALTLKEQEVMHRRRYTAASQEAAAFLNGSALPDPEGNRREKGWALVTVDGYSLGWAKLSAGILKNHYPKGLRK